MQKVKKLFLPNSIIFKIIYDISINTVGDFYDDGYAIVRLGDRFGVIDKSGTYTINPQFDGISRWTNNH